MRNIFFNQVFLVGVF